MELKAFRALTRDLPVLCCLGLALVLLATISAAQAPQKKTNLTRADREAWHRILQWPDNLEARFKKSREGDTSDDSGLVFHSLGQSEFLVEINVDRGTYQPSYVFMHYTDASSRTSAVRLLTFKGYSRSKDGHVETDHEEEIAGLATFNQRTKQLEIYSKARGIGDCGSLVTYKFVGGNPVVVLARAQPRYDVPARWVVDPKRWQKVSKP